MYDRINFTSNNLSNIQAGELRAKFSAAGDRIIRYYIDFRHLELDLHKELSAPELSILQNKVDTLMAQWDKKYETHTRKQDAAAGKATFVSLLGLDAARARAAALAEEACEAISCYGQDAESLRQLARFVISRQT